MKEKLIQEFNALTPIIVKRIVCYKNKVKLICDNYYIKLSYNDIMLNYDYDDVILRTTGCKCYHYLKINKNDFNEINRRIGEYIKKNDGYVQEPYVPALIFERTK